MLGTRTERRAVNSLLIIKKEPLCNQVDERVRQVQCMEYYWSSSNSYRSTIARPVQAMKLSNPVLVAVVISARVEAFQIRPTLTRDPKLWHDSSPSIRATPQGDVDNSKRDVVNELIYRGIEFSPTASAEELQQLLRDEESVSDGRRSHVATRMARRERRRTSRQSSTDDYYKQSFLENNNGYGNLHPREQRRRIRRRPSTRALGDYIRDSIPDDVVRVGAKATKVAKKKTKRVWKNLVELTYGEKFEEYEPPLPPQKRYVDGRPERPTSRYESRRRASRWRPESSFVGYPSASQDDGLREDHKTLRKESSPASNGYHMKKDATATSETSASPTKRSIKDVIKELEDLGLPYSPGASRQDLEDKLSQYNVAGCPSPAPRDDVSSAFLYQKGDDRDGTRDSWKSIPKKTTSNMASYKAKSSPRQVATKAEKVYERAKELSTKLQDGSIRSNTLHDQNLILDAVIEEFSSDQTMHEGRAVEAEPVPTEVWEAKVQATGPRPGVAQQRRRRRRPTPRRIHRPTAKQEDPSPRSRDSERRSKNFSSEARFQLPPGADGTGSRPRRNRGESRPRTVYSPYATRRDNYDYMEDLEGVYQDGVESLGHFMTNAADSFLWGRESRSYRPRQRQPHKRSGHWRDRLEENFDQFMGIHEDGKYYNRWANQDREDRENATGTDAVSYARGRASKPGGRRIRTKPVWEEDGSLLSVLFGTGDEARRRNSKLYHSSSSRRLGGGGASLLRLTQSVVQSCAMIAGSVGRWASVRGTVPQPVIMVGILSAILSARPGRRIQTAVLATLSLRMLGELLHGYMFDDLDFEDDLTREHDEDEESDKGKSAFDVDY
eukprot:scaffold12194_cov129-Cylindrotheca_fusiformis.AAC.13